jgi:CP family cyanate transporter-like MFS transporter
MSAACARRGVWVGAAVLLAALNLRGAVISIAPVLDFLREDPGMSAAVAGLLVSIPVLCFGLSASLAPPIARRLGNEGALVAALMVLSAGILIRVIHPLAAILAGTALIGLAIGVANVVVPTIVKREFPARVGLMTALYVTVMLGFGGLVAAIMVPVSELPGMSVRAALGIWAGPALLAAAVWVPLRRARRDDPAVTAGLGAVSGLWRDSLAWQVTGFMTLQSLGYYAIAGWLPTLFTDNGLSAESGGFMLALASMATIPASLATPIVADRFRTQHAVVVVAVVVTGMGLLGVLLAPTTIPAAWMILMGLGQGATLALGLTFIGLRSSDGRHAAQLSGMVQTVSYLLAAAGPPIIGALHELSGGWTVPLIALLLVLVPMLLLGLGASRPLYVGRRHGEAPLARTTVVEAPARVAGRDART